jgi:hypothetical protein
MSHSYLPFCGADKKARFGEGHLHVAENGKIANSVDGHRNTHVQGASTRTGGTRLPRSSRAGGHSSMTCMRVSTFAQPPLVPGCCTGLLAGERCLGVWRPPVGDCELRHAALHAGQESRCTEAHYGGKGGGAGLGGVEECLLVYSVSNRMALAGKLAGTPHDPALFCVGQPPRQAGPRLCR